MTDFDKRIIGLRKNSKGACRNNDLETTKTMVMILHIELR